MGEDVAQIGRSAGDLEGLAGAHIAQGVGESVFFFHGSWNLPSVSF